MVRVVPSRTNRRRFLGQMYFERRFSLIVDTRPELLQLGPPSLPFEDSLFQRAWTRRPLAAYFFPATELNCPLILSASLDSIQQPVAREPAIESLRSRILHGDTQTGRQMAQCHRGRHLVDVLTAWPARSRENLLELRLEDAEFFHPLLNRPAHRHAQRSYWGAMFSRPCRNTRAIHKSSSRKLFTRRTKLWSSNSPFSLKSFCT